MNMPWFRVLATLFVREMREHRLLFLYLPVACALLACAGFSLWLVQTSGPTTEFRLVGETAPLRLTPDALQEFLRQEMASGRLTPDQAQEITRQTQEIGERRYAVSITGVYVGAESLMLLIFWSSMAFYYLYTLYQSRKDRSILFWNSLPVSNAQTIASKLLAGLVGTYLVYLLCLAAFDVFVWLAVRAWVAMSGTQGFGGYLRDTAPFANALVALAEMPMNILWCLPVYAWLLLASAWPKEAPFAWATGPWVVVVLMEVALTEKSLVFNKLIERLLPLGIARLNEGAYPTPELIAGALLGAWLIAAAIRLNRSDAN